MLYKGDCTIIKGQVHKVVNDFKISVFK